MFDTFDPKRDLIPDSEVDWEWNQAVSGFNGLTFALVKARQRLNMLLKMTPEEVEELFKIGMEKTGFREEL